MNECTSSRIPGFHRLSIEERQARLAELSDLGLDKLAELAEGTPLPKLADFIENVVARYDLPLGIATNFLVDGENVLIPMATEETSVVAAASNAARIVRTGGGFHTEILEDLVIGQIEVLAVPNAERAHDAVEAAREELIALANTAQPSLVPFGGGCRDLEIRWLADNGSGNVLVVHLLVDCKDAMGANSVNAMCELLAPRLAELSGGRPGLRILSNLADRRRVAATATVPVESLGFRGWSGADVRELIVAASRFAERDPYRATTHNKGIMNGVDPLMIATGNDWRAMEAGCHAFASRSGKYSPLATWWRDEEGQLSGRIELPFQLGTVGGVTRLHPVAAACIQLLRVKTAQRLARLTAAVGLGQNLAALKALATEGINRGHMRLHRRNIELANGHETSA